MPCPECCWYHCVDHPEPHRAQELKHQYHEVVSRRKRGVPPVDQELFEKINGNWELRSAIFYRFIDMVKVSVCADAILFLNLITQTPESFEQLIRIIQEHEKAVPCFRLRPLK